MNNILSMILISFITLTNVNCNNAVNDSKTIISDSIPTIVDSNRYTKEPELFCNYFLKNDSISIYLSFNKETPEQLKFDLEIADNNKSHKISDQADLILIQDDNGKMYIPEGTFILDESTNEQYLCDSTYAFNSENINVSFGFEKTSAKRLSLVIYKSKIAVIKNKEYTLYKK